MKSCIFALVVFILFGCSNKKSADQLTSGQEIITPQVLEKVVDLTMSQIQISSSPENIFESLVNSEVLSHKYEIKNISSEVGKIKVNLNFSNYVSVLYNSSTCINSKYTMLRPGSSCHLYLLISTQNTPAGIHPYSFSILDKDNGNIGTTQNFVHIIDPNIQSQNPVAGSPCKINFHMEQRKCFPNIKNCSVIELEDSHATAGTKTWIGSTYGSCQLTQCLSGYTYNAGANTCSQSVSLNHYPVTKLFTSQNSDFVLAEKNGIYYEMNMGKENSPETGILLNTQYYAIDNTWLGLKDITGYATLNQGCIIGSDDLAYCWGNDGLGLNVMGPSTWTHNNTPMLVYRGGYLKNKTIKNIESFGHNNSACAIASDNKVYCWGNNQYGRLGTGVSDLTMPSISLPTPLKMEGELTGLTVKKLVVSYSNGCIIASNDKIYCWGQGSSGILGNNSLTDAAEPVAVDLSQIGFTTQHVSDISLTDGHACLLDSTGSIYCWGDNTYGQLGKGSVSSTPSLRPTTKIVGAPPASKIKIGGLHLV